MIDAVEPNDDTNEEDDTPVRALLDRRTLSGRPFTEKDSVACALVARARAKRLRETDNPAAALIWSHHAGRHMLRARCLAVEVAA